MPDRPGGTDEPEYDWLYGAQGRPGAGPPPAPPQPPPSGDPEPTRMLPTIPRPDASGDGPGGSRRRSTPAATPPPRPPAAPSKRRLRPWRILVVVLLVWVVFLVAVPIWAWQRIDKVDAAPSGARPAEQPGTTYLLVGSDSRENLTKAERRKLGTGDAAGRRTDTVMLLHVGSGPNLLVSIPRDSIVPIPGHGTTKINAAFAFGGPKLLTKTIENDTGVRVDHYVEIGFGGFVNAVDAVGGIRVCTKKRLDDPLAKLHMRKGCHEVNGIKALAFSRTRHTQSLGDIDRAKNQRAVVGQVGSKVNSPWTILNPVRYFRVADAGASSLRISKGTSPLALGRFAFAMTRLDGGSGRTCSMPISDLAVHWDRTRALALMKLVKEDRTKDVGKDLCTPSGLANP